MILRNVLLLSLLSTFGLYPSLKNSQVKQTSSQTPQYELVDYIDSTGAELIDTEIKVGEYPRLTFDFMLLEDSSSFIGGCEQFKLYAHDDQFSLLCYETVVDATGFVPYKRFEVVIGRQSFFQESRYVAFLDLQNSGLSFEYKDWTGTPENKNITLFGGYIGEEMVYSKVRIFEVTLNNVTLKPCHIIETDEYCLVDESTGEFYKDIKGKSFAKDTLAKDITYINKDGNEDIATSAYKLRLDNDNAFVKGNIYVDENISVNNLQLLGDTNLYMFDDVKLTVTQGINETNNGSNYKLNIFGQKNQTGEVLVSGKDGISRSGQNAERAGDGFPAIKIKSLEINGCHLSFVGGNGGDNNCVSTPGQASVISEKFRGGDGSYAALCENININRGVVVFESGKGGTGYNKDVENIFPGQLKGLDLPSIKSQIVINNDNFSCIGGISSEENAPMDMASINYADNLDYQYIKVDTFAEECPYDVIIVDDGASYPFVNFVSCLEFVRTLSDSFVCHLKKDISVNFELSLINSETLDLHGHTLTCTGFHFSNEANVVSTSGIGKIVTNSFSWTNDGVNEYKSVLGFDKVYYIVSVNFEVVENISYRWVDDVCFAKAYHEGLSDILEASQKGEYVMDTPATYTSNEKGHYEATFSNSIFSKQSTLQNSVEVENTMLVEDEEEEIVSSGCSGAILSTSLIISSFALVGVGLLLLKKEH